MRNFAVYISNEKKEMRKVGEDTFVACLIKLYATKKTIVDFHKLTTGRSPTVISDVDDEDLYTNNFYILMGDKKFTLWIEEVS